MLYIDNTQNNHATWPRSHNQKCQNIKKKSNKEEEEESTMYVTTTHDNDFLPIPLNPSNISHLYVIDR